MQRLILCLLIIFLVNFSSQAQEKWDLRKCVDYALENNISVKQADLQTKFSTLQLTQSKLDQLPYANFQGSTGYSFGLSENPATGTLESRNLFNTQFNLSTSITLFNWFSKKFTIEAADLSLQAEKAQVRK